MDRIFEALGEPMRRRILVVLATGEQSAGTVVATLQEQVPISQPAVSQHLKVLRDAGLVTVRAQGTSRIYALDEDAVVAARAWLTGLVEPLARFAQPLDALETEVARGRRTPRPAPSRRPGSGSDTVRPVATDRGTGDADSRSA